MQTNSSKLSAKVETFSKASASFQKLLKADISNLDEVIRDGVKNGQIQKFEYCAELMWKTLKLYLTEVKGIEARSPKEVVKAFYRYTSIGEEKYEILIQIIEDRNRLSHLYREELFNEVYRKLAVYSEVFEELLNIIKDENSK